MDVRPLAHALQERGLAVWFDEFELRIGDSLRGKIDAGIARSRFGLVVLSHAFFSKSWPQYELDGLVTLAVNEQQILLPLWHQISKDEVIQQSPSRADKVAGRGPSTALGEPRSARGTARPRERAQGADSPHYPTGLTRRRPSPPRARALQPR